MTAELETLYRNWRDVADRRSAGGRLRPAADEVASFAAYIDALERAPEEIRLAWQQRRDALEARTLCECGHPPSHHDLDGRCFHVVGCSTACDCRSDSVGDVDAEARLDRDPRGT